MLIAQLVERTLAWMVWRRYGRVDLLEACASACESLWNIRPVPQG